MDSTDVKILERLQKNARIKASVIGQEVNMSVSAVIERIRKLEQSGVISRYTVVLNQRKLGGQVTALVMVKTQPPGAYHLLAQDLLALPRVVECSNITGEFDFMLKIMAPSIEEVNDCVSRLSALDYISNIKTNIVLSSISREDAPLPQQA